MRNKRWLGYSLLLVVAFGIGLAGTIAAAHALVTPLDPASHDSAARELPVSAPRQAPAPTVEC